MLIYIAQGDIYNVGGMCFPGVVMHAVFVAYRHDNTVDMERST